MERESAWKLIGEEELDKLERLCDAYKDFISKNKTERSCCATAISLAEKKGYMSLDEVIREQKSLNKGDKVWATIKGKAVMLINIGNLDMADGFNILGAHIDSPRLDIKQNPLYEANDFALLDTHYYGGIKNYQWVTMPLAIHGVIVKSDGTSVPINIGDDEGDPVFCVTDLLPHLGNAQMKKAGSSVVEGEDLDVLIGNRPIDRQDFSNEVESLEESVSDDAKTDEKGKDVDKTNEEKDPVKARVLEILKDKYGIDEEDFLSAELEVVPAGQARDLGLDRSMILGYGQDDRVCAFTSLAAQLDAGDNEMLEKTGVTILVDKEEIGSVGATGMASNFFENTIAEVMQLLGEDGHIKLRRAMNNSVMLSSDVSAGYDPTYSSVYDAKNSAYLGHGLVFNKYTGSRGKSGSNDASAEYVAHVRKVMDDAQVAFQTAELGKVDAGGGGTIAYIPAKYGMDVIDSGVAVLSMHSPWEVTSKVDIYEAYKGYVAFLKNA
ncbi:MAG: aminopeptidase [Eggerthellaceae bacterium]|nr:aminopeptidase [Eggerthellaceae bacterium]